MSNCDSCCSSCGGCAKHLTITEAELAMLETLSQYPFLPVARRADDMTPIYLEDNQHTREEYSAVLVHLEKKGLIDLDYSRPLARFDYTAYKDYPVRGSMALTQRGQTVLDMAAFQGVEEIT